MVVNFFRLYGKIFYTLDENVKKEVSFANTSNDLEYLLQTKLSIPIERKLTDKEARIWFANNYPDCEVNKIDKHFHFSNRSNDGDVLGD